MLCFALPKDVNKEQVVDQLHIALHHTVQRVPFLAGSVVPNSEQEGDRPWLRNISPNGHAYLDVKDLCDQISYADLAKANFSQDLFDADQLCSLPQVIYIQQEPVEVCRFRVNFIQGGVILVIQILHTVIDGTGVTECVKIFAENLRKAHAGEFGHPLQTTNEKWVSDRTALVSGEGRMGDIENHPAFTTSAFAHGNITGVEQACRTYRISRDALVELKKAASPSFPRDAEDWISTGDAIAALIWRSILVARHRAGALPADAVAKFGQPVDCRKLLELPKPYFGNAFYIMRSDMPFDALRDPQTGLRAAARILRADVKSVTADRIRDLVAFMERIRLESHTRLSFQEDLASSAIVYTSHFKFNIHEMDFGPAFGDGRVKAFRHPARGTIIGSVIVMPMCLDGSCEFMITESADTLRYLETDDLWTRYTGKQNSLGVVGRTALSLPEHTALSDGTNAHSQSQPMPNGTNGSIVKNSCPLTPMVATEPEPIQPCPTILYSSVEAPHGGQIAIIELNRPRASNAISRQLLQELDRELDCVYVKASQSQVRAVIIASTNDNVFCAGADLKERSNMSGDETMDFLTELRHVFSKLASLPIPSIACVSGLALGGGLELALCCHLRVFSGHAVVSLPETKLAIIPGAGGTHRLPRVVGQSHALDMILTGRRVKAVEAAQMGLCNRLVFSGEMDCADLGAVRRLTLANALSLAHDICAGGPIAVRAALSALAMANEEAENAAYTSVLGTSDRAEALHAFQAKRSPQYLGI
ncbi:ClpP/crotonase-like domain-containing protein [Aspergillus caelatus]|uniref:ClpP/crotonase-like domain-containing protein n=1 Tax=Aspergillus caelatus TaxID=61420 RepID=A0A5N7AAA1_9EURO|nr:ClpP/crotonase-like domain-containing protein [Aspergillus caelatus]KAE8365530.1 ClpP/crotonase-like domain-containing protein [Aspergillus caelatus]